MRALNSGDGICIKQHIFGIFSHPGLFIRPLTKHADDFFVIPQHYFTFFRDKMAPAHAFTNFFLIGDIQFQIPFKLLVISYRHKDTGTHFGHKMGIDEKGIAGKTAIDGSFEMFGQRTVEPELLEKIEVDKNRVRIAEERFPSLRRLFRTAGNTGSFHLYDASGKKIASGKNGLEYEAGPKVYLNELIRGEFFSIDEFVKMGESVKNMEWMRQIDSIITGEDKKLFVFFLFINLCEPCGGGAVVDQLKQLNANYGKQAGIFSISYSRYTDRDIAALKSQAKIKFPITLADSLLFGKWESLIRRYNRRRLDNIVFVTDKSGKILNVMHSTCKCFRSFFRITHSIMKERLEI